MGDLRCGPTRPCWIKKGRRTAMATRYTSIVSAILLTFGLASFAAPGPGEKQEFSALYDRISAKFVRLDTKGVAAFFRTDFIYVGSNGQRLGKEAFLRSAFALVRQVKLAKDVELVDSVKVSGGVATIDVHEVFSGRIDLGDKKIHTWKQTDTATDTWVMTGHTWLLKKSVEHTSARFLGGNPSPPIGQLRRGVPR